MTNSNDNASNGVKTDESLAMAYQNGDNSAVAILIHRYEKPLWRFALRSSQYKDRQFIDDILQVVFILIFKLLKDRRFRPEYDGSFRTWAFNICKKITLHENQSRKHLEKPISAQYQDEISADITARRFADSLDTLRAERRMEKLKAALDRLKPEERKLIDLRNQEPPVPFDKIKDMPEFPGSNAGQLRTEHCRLLDRLREYIEGMTIQIVHPGTERPERTECLLGNLSGA
ncbi:MAG: sigma-70 family RNA polymerase sigma factor [Planctomycetes bacterium]|nr:sigma-70 family RNA polymerase sigma factor [Planctomycetota bacterium]